MKKQFTFVIQSVISILLISCWFISNAWSMELITRKDLTLGTVTNSDLLKTADNAIILLSSSSSMEKPYKDTGMTRYEAAKKILKERNLYFPDLGHNFGLYLYTPWTDLYPIQKYDKEKFAAALDRLPEKAEELPLLAKSMQKLDSILAPLEGRTAVFFFTDGAHTKIPGEDQTAQELAAKLAGKYDVCFYLISTADDTSSMELFEKVQGFNFCSRVIAFEDYINRPLYNSEALFTVKATTNILSISDKKVVGIKVRNFLFDAGSTDLSQDQKERLAVLGEFLKENKRAYAALGGHTDNIETEEDNMDLSYRRVKKIFNYLVGDLNVNKSQLAPFSFGQSNPIADNSNREGRKLNRRVEILVGGI